MKEKRRKGLDEEAACCDDSDGDDNFDDSDEGGSISQFIVPDGNLSDSHDDDVLPDSADDKPAKTIKSVAVRKRGRPAGSSSKKRQNQSSHQEIPVIR